MNLLKLLGLQRIEPFANLVLLYYNHLWHHLHLRTFHFNIRPNQKCSLVWGFVDFQLYKKY